MSRYLLAIDAGTSSNRAVLFDASARACASAQLEFPQLYPRPGWVEHDPEAIWGTVVQVIGKVLADSGIRAQQLAGIGITNQRETTLIWDRATGECIHHAIVWQDRRTADSCARLKAEGAEPAFIGKTGLRLDPYFSGTKIAWLLEHVDGARQRAEQGRLAFGTVDSFLLWRLTGGKVHSTDATNASRTLLFNIHTQDWDEELLRLLSVPRELLPEVHDCAADFGNADVGFLDAPVPICGMAGDQHAALIGQAGFADGLTKSTYGTGCFIVANTGKKAIKSANQLLTTLAYRLDGDVTYAIEGSIFVAGSAIQWLRDKLGIIGTAAESEQLARTTGVVEHVHVVPAFTGLGAAYWVPHARAAILGLSRDSSVGDIVTATLQAVAYQTADLVNAMADDGLRPSLIRVDGGMVSNDWFLQFLSDVLGLPVERPAYIESTVLGAAFLAGLQCGVYDSRHDIESIWRRDRLFEPQFDKARRDSLYEGWQRAVARVRNSG